MAGPVSRGAGAAGLATALAAALALGPRLDELGTRVLGMGGVDHPGTVWTHAQLRHALVDGPSVLLDARGLYHPWGQDLGANTGLNLLDAALSVPFAGFGEPLGHNLFLLALLVANGLAAAAWARALGGGAAAAGWVGLAVGLAPFPVQELVEGRPTQALLAPFLLAAWALGRVLEGRDRGVALGLAWAVLGYQYWFYALFFAGIAAVALGARLIGGGGAPAARGVAVGAAVALALAAPVAGPLALGAAAGAVPGLMDPRAPDGLLLHSLQPALGVVGYLDGDTFVGTARVEGLLVLLAAGALSLRAGGGLPGSRLAAFGLVGFAVGPGLVVAGAWRPEPLYVALVDAFPPLARLWHPSRALAGVVVLAVPWLVALGPRARAAFALGSVAAAALAGLLPLPTWDARAPAAYRCLGEGAVLELPFAGSQRHLAWQAEHGHPILGGMHEGAPAFQHPEAVALREHPFVAGLLAAARGQRPGPLGDGEAVRALGYRWVVWSAGEYAEAPPALQRRVEATLVDLLGPPLHADARVRVWAPWGDRMTCADADAEPAEPVRERRLRDLGTWRVPRPTAPGGA